MPEPRDLQYLRLVRDAVLASASGQHYLVDQTDVPFFLTGDSARSLMVGVTTEDATAYLRNRQPSSGTFTTVSGSPFGKAGTQTFTPNGNNSQVSPDWSLVLEAS
jgi:hypothetical protein